MIMISLFFYLINAEWKTEVKAVVSPVTQSRCNANSELNIDIDLPRQSLSVLCSDGKVLLTGVRISSGAGIMKQGQYKSESGETIKYSFCGRTDGSPYDDPTKKEDRKLYSVGPGTVMNQKKSTDFNLLLKNIVMIDPKRGTYIHAAPAGTEGQLGTPTSSGCVRVLPSNAKKIVDIVRAHPKYGVKVIGQAPTSYKQCQHKNLMVKLAVQPSKLGASDVLNTDTQVPEVVLDQEAAEN